MTMSRWDIKNSGMPIGDPFGGPAYGKYQDPFTAVAVTASIMGAYGSYQSGQIAREQYGLQARVSTLEGERKQIQYMQRANDIQRRLQATNSALAARAYAGGIDPFSGSPDVVRAANETAFGREYMTILSDADAALRAGRLQAQIYEQAGETAARKGTFDAIAKLGMAAATYGAIKAAPPGADTVTLGG